MVSETLTACHPGTGAPKRDGLASRGGTWQGAGMTSPTNSPRAGGCAIALLALVGAVIGNIYHQPSIGLIAGVGLGAAIALGLWLKDRR
jgi:hypothetical protein